MVTRLANALRYIRSQGLRNFLYKVANRIANRTAAALAEPVPEGHKSDILVYARYDDVVASDYTRPIPAVTHPKAIVTEKLRTAWVMPPPSAQSGGHHTLFRFLDYLEQAGHSAEIFVYREDPAPLDVAPLNAMIAQTAAYPKLKARLHDWPGATGVGPGFDLIFATSWETAYPVWGDPSDARRYYFVQDFEPFFFPVGSLSTLAENTYKFGFRGITAGKYLAHRVQRDYGMIAEGFDFSADTSIYHKTNAGPREGIFFYARPFTARRGFELGTAALHQFHRMRPEVPIHLAGERLDQYRFRFPAISHGPQSVQQLAALFNQCSTGLIMSLTNFSLMPLEMVACGCIPVVTEGENNSMVSDNPYLRYTPCTPAALARAMVEVIDHPQFEEQSAAAAASIAGTNWDASGRQFIEILERSVRD